MLLCNWLGLVPNVLMLVLPVYWQNRQCLLLSVDFNLIFDFNSTICVFNVLCCTQGAHIMNYLIKQISGSDGSV